MPRSPKTIRRSVTRVIPNTCFGISKKSVVIGKKNSGVKKAKTARRIVENLYVSWRAGCRIFINCKETERPGSTDI
jgi:hypothetical protein